MGGFHKQNIKTVTRDDIEQLNSIPAMILVLGNKRN